MDEDLEDAQEWLGGEHDGQRLNDAIKSLLIEGFKANIWTMDDVPSLDEEAHGTVVF